MNYKTICEIHQLSSRSILERWCILEKDYPTLASLAKALLVLPYSMTAVESTFSQFKAFKTCYRNRLSLENLEASVLAEQHFKKEKMDVLPEMVSRYYNLWSSNPPNCEIDLKKKEALNQEDQPAKELEVKSEQKPQEKPNDLQENRII